MTGKQWENEIAIEIQQQVDARKLLAWKFPTPYNILETYKNGKFKGVWSTSTIDFIGMLAPHGRFLAIEAKSTQDQTLSVLYGKRQKGSGIKRHQLNVLVHVACTGGIAVVLVYDEAGDRALCLPVGPDGSIGPFPAGTKTLPLATLSDEYIMDDLLKALRYVDDHTG